MANACIKRRITKGGWDSFAKSRCPLTTAFSAVILQSISAQAEAVSIQNTSSQLPTLGSMKWRVFWTTHFISISQNYNILRYFLIKSLFNGPLKYTTPQPIYLATTTDLSIKILTINNFKMKLFYITQKLGEQLVNFE